LKKKHGCALSSMVQENDAIEVPTVGGRKPRLLSLQVMAEILQPRAEEIFRLVRDEIIRANFEKSLNAGIALTGGGSLLPGMTEMAEQVFEMPVRLGQPSGAEALIEPMAGPQHATAIGLARYSGRNRRPQRRFPLGVHTGSITRVGDRVRAWFSEMF
jgi:cell division protein FtsA